MMTQNTLRDKQLEPKHAMQSDLTIFGQPAAEVRGLFTDVSPAVGDPQALKDLQNTRKSRHDAAWKGYLERKQQCYEQVRPSSNFRLSCAHTLCMHIRAASYVYCLCPCIGTLRTKI